MEEYFHGSLWCSGWCCSFHHFLPCVRHAAAFSSPWRLAFRRGKLRRNKESHVSLQKQKMWSKINCNENETRSLHQNDLLCGGSHTLTWASRRRAGRGVGVSGGRPFGAHIVSDAAERRCLWSFISGSFQRQQLSRSLEALLHESLARGLAVRPQFSRVDFWAAQKKRKTPHEVNLVHETEKRYHI